MVPRPATLCCATSVARSHSLAALAALAVMTLSACTMTGAGTSPRAPSGASSGRDDPSAAATAATRPEPLRLVTLGDAYTAGTGTLAPRHDSWPAQLATAMEHGDVRLRLVDNLADSGQTSEDVLRSQLPQLDALVPDVVTLQVGVNDIIARDISLADYQANLAAIVAELLADLPPCRIFLITMPDHTLTMRGGDWGSRESGHAEVVAANGILAQVAAEHGVEVVDIGPVNARADDDASLVIGDGPYPTAKQYAGWVEVIGPAIAATAPGCPAVVP